MRREPGQATRDEALTARQQGEASLRPLLLIKRFRRC
jgi:hypothetical protein